MTLFVASINRERNVLEENKESTGLETRVEENKSYGRWIMELINELAELLVEGLRFTVHLPEIYYKGWYGKI